MKFLCAFYYFSIVVSLIQAFDKDKGDIFKNCNKKPKYAYRLLRGMRDSESMSSINSVAQCLLIIPKLFNFLNQLPLCKGKIDSDRYPLTGSFSKVATQFSSTKRPRSPIRSPALNVAYLHKAVVRSLMEKSEISGFDNSTDLVQSILDRLHKEIQEFTGSDPIIFDQFRTIVRNELLIRGAVVPTVEKFLTIPMDVESVLIHSITDALNAFIVQDADYERNGRKFRTKRRMRFEILPPVLILNLKTPDQDVTRGSKKIRYPMVLDIPRNATVDGFVGSRRYKLNAVVHRQSATRFVASVSHNGQWYLVDNAKIVQRHPQGKPAKNWVPDLLFYGKQG